MKKTLPKYVVLALSLSFVPTITAADESTFEWLTSFDRKKGVSPVSNPVYKEECGACHFPYQPGLLPARSWQKLLQASALADHFGDNAELDEGIREALLVYTTENAADKSLHKRSKKIMASLRDDATPMRITETPYIKEKHHEIPDRLIKQNDQVKSLSYCNKCHTSADKGSFDDDDVKIPGYGRWDD